MTRVQFLNNLYHHLYGMTREQAEQHLTYYAEMLADRMEEGMSEEDAVASLEDVETIARRIMEEEGLPYTPPNQRPITPLAYPAVSRLGGGDGARAYQPPQAGEVVEGLAQDHADCALDHSHYRCHRRGEPLAVEPECAGRPNRIPRIRDCFQRRLGLRGSARQ